MLTLPEKLEKVWYTRPYYGTLAHNAKAVYQKFMGWYDSNPVNLNPLMPSDSAKKWVEYLGDVDKVLQMAKADFDKGEYQWVAEVTNTIVFADPTNTDARLLCADALEQLGYQAESGPWRNEYLTAAQELRHGNANFTASTKSTGDMVKALSAPMLFDYMAIVMDKQALADRDFTMNVILPDVGEQHMLRVKNGVLLVYADTLSDDADVSITCPKNALFAILTNNQETVAKAVKVEGSAELLTLMMDAGVPLDAARYVDCGMLIFRLSRMSTRAVRAADVPRACCAGTSCVSSARRRFTAWRSWRPGRCSPRHSASRAARFRALPT